MVLSLFMIRLQYIIIFRLTGNRFQTLPSLAKMAMFNWQQRPEIAILFPTPVHIVVQTVIHSFVSRICSFVMKLDIQEEDGVNFDENKLKKSD